MNYITEERCSSSSFSSVHSCQQRGVASHTTDIVGVVRIKIQKCATSNSPWVWPHKMHQWVWSECIHRGVWPHMQQNSCAYNACSVHTEWVWSDRMQRGVASHTTWVRGQDPLLLTGREKKPSPMIVFLLTKSLSLTDSFLDALSLSNLCRCPPPFLSLSGVTRMGHFHWRCPPWKLERGASYLLIYTGGMYDYLRNRVSLLGLCP